MWQILCWKEVALQLTIYIGVRDSSLKSLYTIEDVVDDNSGRIDYSLSGSSCFTTSLLVAHDHFLVVGFW